MIPGHEILLLFIKDVNGIRGSGFGMKRGIFRDDNGSLLAVADLEGNTGQPANRPKLLFLAYPFPPLQAVGAVRTGNMARYLARLGWDVTVVTPDPSIWRNVDNIGKVSAELEREGIKRILTGHRWRCLSAQGLKCWNQNVGWVAGGICRMIAQHLGIDKHVGWVKETERACSNLNPRDVDIILVSGSPFVAFRLARRLSVQARPALCPGLS